MRPCARCFIYNPQADAVLLIERFKEEAHYWTVPGGGVLSGETPAAGVQRELAEELEMTLNVKQLRVLVRAVRQGNPETYFAYDLEDPQACRVHAVELARSTDTNRYEPKWVPRTELVAKLPYLDGIVQEAAAGLAQLQTNL